MRWGRAIVCFNALHVILHRIFYMAGVNHKRDRTKMKRFLPLFAFAVMAIVGASNAHAQSADINGVMTEGGKSGVWTVGPSGTTRTDLPPECMPGGALYETQVANNAAAYARAKIRVENAFAPAVPKPASAYNCLSNIFSIFSTLSNFTWPPNLSGLFAGFIDQIINKACSALWNAIAGSSLVANYNKAVGTYNMTANCTNDLTACKPIADAKAGIEGSISFGF